MRGGEGRRSVQKLPGGLRGLFEECGRGDVMSQELPSEPQCPLHCTESSEFPAFPSAHRHRTKWRRRPGSRCDSHCVDSGCVWDLAAATLVSSCPPSVETFADVLQSSAIPSLPLWCIDLLILPEN